MFERVTNLIKIQEKKMKTRNLVLLLTMLIIAAFALSACGGGATEAPAEPTKAPTEAPMEEPTEAPMEEPTEAPMEEPTEEPMEEATEEPTEEPMAEPCAPATDGPLAGVDPRGQTIVWWHNHSGSREENMLPLLDQFSILKIKVATMTFVIKSTPASPPVNSPLRLSLVTRMIKLSIS